MIVATLRASCCWALVILALAVLSGFTGCATTLTTGQGKPDLAGWCRLDWNAGCTTGLTVLSGSGLTLIPSQSPPPSSYELSLKLIPGRSLLFVFESPSTTGRITFSVDGLAIRSLPPPTTGLWWARLSDLPDTGILRVELDRYCDEITIQSISHDCLRRPPPPTCWREFILGAIAGALAALVVCWFVMP